MGAGEPTCKPCVDAAYRADIERAEALISGTRVCRGGELAMGPCADALYLVTLEGLAPDSVNTVACETHLGVWVGSTLANADRRRVVVERYYSR
jgi:hypothetical protein